MRNFRYSSKYIIIIVLLLLLVGCTVSWRSAYTESQNYKAMLEVKDDIIKSQSYNIEELQEEYDHLKDSILSISENWLYVPVEIDRTWKSWMDYRTITDKTSRQYRIVNSVNCYIDENGLLVYNDGDIDYYCVAMGSYYGDVGDKFSIQVEDGIWYNVLMAELKADQHTDVSNRYTVGEKVNCMLEFLVDSDVLDDKAKISGNINDIEEVSGKIVNIIKMK